MQLLEILRRSKILLYSVLCDEFQLVISNERETQRHDKKQSWKHYN